MVEMGKYDKHLLEDYSAEEFEQMDSFIDHWRDMNFSYAAAVKQLEGKYLVQNRVSGEIYESAPVPVCWCPLACSPTTRVKLVWITSNVSDAISTFKISLPTPIMSGVRTNPPVQLLRADRVRRQPDSINATSSAIVKYVSAARRHRYQRRPHPRAGQPDPWR